MKTLMGFVCAGAAVSLMACRGASTDDLAKGSVRAIVPLAQAAGEAPGQVAPSNRGSRSDVVPASELEIVEHTVSLPPRGADDKEDYWIQFQIWGEMRNRSTRTVRVIAADITYHDAAGNMIPLDSIGTAVKADHGDTSPGETFYSEVHDIPPGGSAPFHYMRNLAAIRGKIASHKLALRPATAVDGATAGVLVGAKEWAGDMKNPSLPGSQAVSRMRAFEGSIRNDGKTGCKDPRLVVGLLSPAGKIVELHTFDAKPDGNLGLVVKPGASVPVKGAVHVSFDDTWREKAAAKTWIDCDTPS
jgi:hypothetical protein